MKDKYIIVDLTTMEYFKNIYDAIHFFDTEEEAGEYCGIYELDNCWILKLVHQHKEEENGE
jgi:hypothetical protein